MSTALTTPNPKIRVQQHLAVPMRDGTTLYGDVWRPVGDDKGGYPTLIIRTPYGVQRDNVHAGNFKWALAGYAVFIQDVRGRYESEGKWYPFVNEVEDGVDTCHWVSKQPWCNGQIGFQGGSYLGHVQWRALTGELPKELKVAFPAVASTNIYKNWMTHEGAWRLSFNYGWGVVRMPYRIMQPQFFHCPGYGAPPEMQYKNVLNHLPLKNADLASADNVTPHYRDWIEHPAYDEYWKNISDEENFEKIQVPVMTSGGWYDIFLQGTIRGYTEMRKRGATKEAREQTRMIVGPWGHVPTRKFGEIDFGPTAYRAQGDIELKWFDYHLRGKNNGLESEPPVEIYYMGANVWKHEQDWPVPGTKYTPFYLSTPNQAPEFSANSAARSKGALSLAPPQHTTPTNNVSKYKYDPENPCPTVGGNNCCGTPTSDGPRDQKPLDGREDVLVYNSSPMAEPLAIAGPVNMKLFAATDGLDTDWVVKLIDVHPDGKAYNIAEGIVRARFREGIDKEVLLTPNKVYEYDVDLIGTANVFLPGHRIRVDISSSHFPQFDRNPNTGDKFGESTATRIASQTIFHSDVQASHIILPVVPVPTSVAAPAAKL